MARSEWFLVPNLITYVRIALVPVFLWLHLSGRPGWALIAFAAAAASDGIDGLLARALDQRSKLGAILDPVADKLLVVSALVALLVAGRAPLWLCALILFRDGAMVVGAVVVRRKRLELPSQPTRVGKYATFSLLLFVVLSMLEQSLESARLLAYVRVIGFIAGLCVAVSTVQYFARFGHLFFDPPRSAKPG